MHPVVKREQITAGQWVVRPLLEPAEAPLSAVAAGTPPTVAPEPEDETLERQQRLLSALAANLVKERGRQLTALRPELLKLVLLVCQELLGREVTTPPAVIDHTLAAALKMLNGAGGLVARVNPEEAALLEQRWSELPAHERPGQIRLVADSALGPGECRLDSDRGAIDATWETQLGLVRQALSPDEGGELD